MQLTARDRTIDLRAPVIVGVVNATPDSFSDSSAERGPEGAMRRAERLVAEGADVIEVGGESNVSNGRPVPAAEEAERVVPLLGRIVRELGVPVSVDTHKPDVAAAALDAGAHLVNDVSGLADPRMPGICAAAGAAVVVVHTETPPKTVRWDEDLYPGGVVARIVEFLEGRIALLHETGVEREQIVLDPAPDFAKTPAQTVEALRGLDRIAAVGFPVMAAVSRKDFVGALTGRPPRERGAGTLAAVGAALDAGARMLRVHDVAATRDYVAVWRALRGEAEVPAGLRISEEIRREDPATRPTS